MIPVSRREKDPLTGLEVCYVTDWSEPSRKTYFTNEAWRSDNQAIVFLSERGGTESTPVRVWMAVDGEFVLLTAGEGWDAASFGMDRARDVGYITRGQEIWQIDLHTGEAEPLAHLPFEGRATGHLSCSRSGRIVGGYRLRRGYYVLAATELDGSSKILMRSDTPLGHVQACPGDDKTIFYVHETGGDAVQRTWLYDMELGEYRPYYIEDEDDWITHETWDHSGDFVYFIKHPHAILRGDREGKHFEPVVEGDYHHCAPSPTGKWIVADRTWTGEILLIDAIHHRVFTIAAGQGATRGEDHCHPSFNRRGDEVLFTAPCGGNPQVAFIDLKQLNEFAP